MALVTRLFRAWEALTGHDFTASIVGLPPEQLRRIGALTLDEERSEAVEQRVMEQRHTYEDASKDQLIETLIDRDRQLMREGRRLADGTVGSRVLREFMRASLYAADGKANPAMVERVLLTLGAEPADARQLKQHGSTLGPIMPLDGEGDQ
jgi:hypothetical protein